MPAEVAVEVFRGYPVEPAHPAFEAAVVIVDVLDMVDALDALACAQIERHMRKPRLAGECAIGRGAVADQHRRFGDHRFQRRRKRFCRAVWQDLIAVALLRSRAISTGTCSSDKPRFDAFPPRLRAGRVSLREPFSEYRK